MRTHPACAPSTTMSKLRIAQVAPVWTAVPPNTYGGTERRVYLLTEELVRRGHQVTLFASADSVTSATLRAVCQINLIESMEKGDAYAYDYYANANLAEALRDASSFDVINCHLGSPWIPLGTASRTPVLHTLNTALTVDDIWMLAHYPEVPVSALSHSQIATVPLPRREKIAVVYNGCDFDAFEALETPGKYLAFLGRMGPLKNPYGAIRIAQEVGIPIVLAGHPQDRTEVEYFNEQIMPLIDGKNVNYIGLVNHAQKNELLKHAAALLFPIQWVEPFGNVMIEAMACGTPVLACNYGSVGEVIDPGKTGFYADSVEALPALIPQILSLDRQLVRQHARQRFSHKNMTDGYLRQYDRLLNQAA